MLWSKFDIPAGFDDLAFDLFTTRHPYIKSLICKFLSYDCDGRDPRKDAELLVVDKGDGGSRVRVG